MTAVYFVRHAEPNSANHDGRERELSEKGLRDRTLVTCFLADKQVEVVLSSPYRRAIAVRESAGKCRLPIRTIDDFRERRVDDGWNEVRAWNLRPLPKC